MESIACIRNTKKTANCSYILSIWAYCVRDHATERCVLCGTHLRSDGQHLLLSPLRKLSERRRTRNQNIQYFTVCGVTSPSTVHLLSGQGTGETLKTCLTGLRGPAVSSPPVNKFLTESTSRATY